MTLGDAKIEGEAARIYRVRATPMRNGKALLGAALVLEDVTRYRLRRTKRKV